MDRLFTEAPDVEDVFVILHQGQEVELMHFWSDTWGLRQHLIKVTGATLDPATVPLTARWYDRYTVVTP